MRATFKNLRKNLRVSRRSLGLWASLSVLALISASKPARADVGDFGYVAYGDYGYQIVHMPDIDQRRDADFINLIWGLPNKGSMYCVPTSSMNHLAYIANHGFPGVTPGPGIWQPGQPNALAMYNLMSNDLLNLGADMNTDPFKGTGGGAAITALKNRLDPTKFVVSSWSADKSQSPLSKDLALLAIQGSLVNLGVGWYTNPDTNLSHVRVGGHLVTLVAASSPGLFTQPYPQVGIHDPANDNYLFSQSAFTTDTWNIQDASGMYGYYDQNMNPVLYSRTQSRMIGYGSGYIDGSIIITPKQALASYGPFFVVLAPVVVFNAENHQAAHIFSSATGDNIADMVQDPISVKHPYLIEGSDSLFEFNSLTGVSNLLPAVQLPGVAQLPAVQRPQRIVMGGRSRSLFVLQATQITRLSRNGIMERSAPLREPLAAIAYDEKHEELVGYARQSGRVYVYNTDLQLIGSVLVPQPFCPLNSTARLNLSINPTNGDLWAHADGAANVFCLRVAGVGAMTERSILLEGLRAPQGLDVDENGDLFVTEQGTVRVFDGAGKLDKRSPLLGMRGGDTLHVLRPYSNFDPTTMVGPSWVNVLPPAGL